MLNETGHLPMQESKEMLKKNWELVKKHQSQLEGSSNAQY